MSALSRLGVAALNRLPPEAAQRLGIALLRRGFAGRRAGPRDPALRVRLWGRDFGAIGIAAGLDKNGEAFAALLRAGAGFVEIGTVTPRPQPGNPRPRLFRLRDDQAVINRLGFNSAGMDHVAKQLRRRERANGIVGVNIGVNRNSTDPANDYVAAFDRLAPLADYVTVNVSSPNTPGLRDLQARDRLAALVDALHARRAATGLDCPLLVKVSPDLRPAAVREIAAIALDGAIDGLVIGNTTVARPPGLRASSRHEAGGLSGRPLFAPSTALLGAFYRLVGGRVPLIGVGGVASADDAWAKIRAGASLVQLYTALAFRGLGLLADIERGLAARLARDGLTSVADAVGAGIRDDARCLTARAG